MVHGPDRRCPRPRHPHARYQDGKRGLAGGSVERDDADTDQRRQRPLAAQASWIVGPASNPTLRRRASAVGRRDGEHADHLPGRAGYRQHQPLGASVRLGQPARPQPPGADGRPGRVQPARAAGRLTELLDRLAGASPAPIGERLRRRFREQRAHLLQLVEATNGLGTLLSNALQAYQTEVSLRQNDDMRRISAWVAIWAVPTLLAGIYGMNFRYLPELEWLIGYPLVLATMAAICLGLYRAFRRSGWL
jgi:CorA-like Mg2+ transporter protein